LRQAYDYWQDQPGNCPTRTGPRRSPHEATGTRGVEHPSPQPELVTDQTSRPLGHKSHRTPHPNGQPVPMAPETRVPSPPISHASGTLPQSRGDWSRPLRWRLPASGRTSTRGLPGRGVSPSGWLRAELAQWLSGPHLSASLATVSKALCKAHSHLPGSQLGPLARSITFEPGHISLPKRAHPARQAHQPLGPRTASRPQAASAGVRKRSWAESTPVLPAVPAPRAFAPTPVRHPSIPKKTTPPQRRANSAPGLSFGQVKGQAPTHACTESKGHPNSPSTCNRTTTTHPSPGLRSLQNQTP
jgi:hypothetical protein